MKTCLLLVGAFFYFGCCQGRGCLKCPDKNLTADEMSTLALKDSMYYHYDEWFYRFQGEINREIPSVVGFWFA